MGGGAWLGEGHPLLLRQLPILVVHSPPTAVTALLFKMEEANLASRAKAQELIQATNQVGFLGEESPQPFSCPLLRVRRGTSAPSRLWGKVSAGRGACCLWDCWEIRVGIGVHVPSSLPPPFAYPPTFSPRSSATGSPPQVWG